MNILSQVPDTGPVLPTRASKAADGHGSLRLEAPPCGPGARQCAAVCQRALLPALPMGPQRPPGPARNRPCTASGQMHRALSSAASSPAVRLRPRDLDGRHGRPSPTSRRMRPAPGCEQRPLRPLGLPTGSVRLRVYAASTGTGRSNQPAGMGSSARKGAESACLFGTWSTCQCACMASDHLGRRAAGLMRHRALEVSILSGAATEQQIERGETHEYAHHTNHNLSHTNIKAQANVNHD